MTTYIWIMAKKEKIQVYLSPDLVESIKGSHEKRARLNRAGGKQTLSSYIEKMLRDQIPSEKLEEKAWDFDSGYKED